MDFTVLDFCCKREGESLVPAYLIAPTGLPEDKADGIITVRCLNCYAVLSYAGCVPAFTARCPACFAEWAEYTPV